MSAMVSMCLGVLVVIAGVTEARVAREVLQDESETNTTLTSTTTTQSPERDCSPYRYCDGESFPHRVKVRDRAVQCDVAPNTRERCCLPSSKHLVCYNIRVEGQFLSYDRNDNSVSTDFASLCKSMATEQGHGTGKLGAASLATGEKGVLIYRYDRWYDIDIGESGQEYLKDVACEITDEDEDEDESEENKRED